MDRRDFLYHSLRSAALTSGAICLTGCGSVLYRERVHQPHSRDIDWSIAALNGLGLALFFVPGVVAFAVDFYTGAIYLPPEYYGGYPPMESPTPPAGPEPTPVYESVPAPMPAPASPPQAAVEPAGSAQLERIALRPAQLNQRGIEQVVAAQIGQPVALDDSNVRMSPLERLEQFAAVRKQHEQDPLFGAPPLTWFEQSAA